MIKRIGAVLLLPTLSLAQANLPVSVSSGGVLANNRSYYSLISADGRYVVFQSEASNLTANDFNGQYDIFRRDLQASVTELVSVGISGTSASGLGLSPAVSGDGRYVSWASNAPNLVSGDNNGTWDVFLRDMVLSVTTRISLTSTGGEASLRSDQPRITPDGRFVTFESDADLIPGDTNGLKDCYRLDRNTGTLDLVSTSSSGTLGNSISYAAQPSDDGRYVCFFSAATNLVPGDTNNQADVFWKDMQTSTLLRANVSTAGVQANNESIWPSISGDGQTVSFCSRASNLVTGDTNGNWDLFARDVPAGVTTRLNLQPNGLQADSYVRSPTALTTDGRYVIYASLSTNLVPGDTNGFQDIFMRDRLLQVTERVSYGHVGDQTDSDNFVPHMTPDTQVITYTSTATNIVPGDTNGFRDIFASILGPDEPGEQFGGGGADCGGVLCPCPCGNNNDGSLLPDLSGCATTQNPEGMRHWATGVASLSGDTVVLRADHMKPSTTGIFFKGNGTLLPGAPLGGANANGLLQCASVKRFPIVIDTDGDGAVDSSGYAKGIGTLSNANAGDTLYYQWWARTPKKNGPCTNPSSGGSNSSNGYSIVWGA